MTTSQTGYFFISSTNLPLTYQCIFLSLLDAASMVRAQDAFWDLPSTRRCFLCSCRCTNRVIHEAGPGLRSEWQCSPGSFGDVVESPVTTLAALQLYSSDEDEGSFYIHKKKKVILGYQRENCWMAPYFLSFGVFPNAAIEGKSDKQPLLSQVMYHSLAAMLDALPQAESEKWPTIPAWGKQPLTLLGQGITRQWSIGLGRAAGISGKQKAHRLLLWGYSSCSRVEIP